MILTFLVFHYFGITIWDPILVNWYQNLSRYAGSQRGCNKIFIAVFENFFAWFISDLFVTNTIKILTEIKWKSQKLHEMMRKFWILVSEETSFMTPQKGTS